MSAPAFIRQQAKARATKPLPNTEPPRLTLADAEELLDELLFDRGMGVPEAADHVAVELGIEESEALGICAEHRAQLESEGEPRPEWRRKHDRFSWDEIDTADLPF